MKITPEEILAYDIFTSPQSASALKLTQLSEFEWTEEELELSSLHYGDWTPSKPLPTEGYNPSNEPYDEGKMEEERKKHNSDYAEKWADEFYAREYAKLLTDTPAIIVEEENGFKIKSGRHRSRSAYLKGKKTIIAYVGRKISK